MKLMGRSVCVCVLCVVTVYPGFSSYTPYAGCSTHSGLQTGLSGDPSPSTNPAGDRGCVDNYFEYLSFFTAIGACRFWAWIFIKMQIQIR